jgi:hypothetical protein
VSEMDSGQLRALLEAAVGEPPHRVTVAAVRRRVVRRRVTEAVGGAAAVVVIAGLGVTAAVQLSGAGPGSTTTSRAGAPRYYVQQSFAGGGESKPTVVRATATGAVTATIRCPWPHALIAPHGVTAAGHQAFYVVCEGVAKHGKGLVVAGSRIYRFRLTGSGRIGGYSPVRGGVLGAHRFEGSITATLDGSQVAVTAGPTTFGSGLGGPTEVLVINTQTGARAVWHSGAKVLGADALTFTNNGRELEFVGTTRCAQKTGITCSALRAVSPATAGGGLDHSRLLLPLSSLARSRADYINDVLISPDGSTLTAAIVRSPDRAHNSTSILVVEYSATTGRQLRVLYQMRTGNGMFYRFLGSDLTRRYLLYNAGPTGGTVNGWIDHGRLIRLKPADGSNILYETW